MPEDEQICRFAIEGTKYILIEFPFTEAWTFELLDRLSSFIANTGYTPIIAHAERYKEVHKNPALLNELIGMGCLIQVNAGSFLGGREKKLAYAMLKHGFVHCIGSDAHDTETRKPCLSEAKQAIETAGLGIEWDKIQENMQTILNGEKVEVEYALPVKKFFGRYR
jgi:protein-tyrosine phosphatase